MEKMMEYAKSAEAAEELRKLQSDPEAMQQVREMMDDPEFRRQMLEAVGKGGNEKLEELRSSIAQDSDLTEQLTALGPPLGAALDLLKRSTENAAEFDEAANALSALARTAATRGESDPKYRRVRLSNTAIEQRLLRHPGGKRCLEALGFTEEVEIEGEPHLERNEKAQPAAALERALEKIEAARSDAATAEQVSKAHGLPYRIAVELPEMKRAIAGDEELGQLLTQLLLHNEEFRSTIAGPMAEMVLPSILQLLRSKEGLRGVVEYYTGAPLTDSRVIRVETVSEWKEALEQAGERPVCALFTSLQDVGCRLLAPVFSRLPTSAEDGAFAEVDFVQVGLDTSQDDGLVEHVFAEAYVGLKETPTFAFFTECLEHKRWRYRGAEIGEVVKRLKRILANDKLDDGPDEE